MERIPREGVFTPPITASSMGDPRVQSFLAGRIQMINETKELTKTLYVAKRLNDTDTDVEFF